MSVGTLLRSVLHTFLAAFAAFFAAFAAAWSVVRAALTAVAVPFFFFLASRTGMSRRPRSAMSMPVRDSTIDSRSGVEAASTLADAVDVEFALAA